MSKFLLIPAAVLLMLPCHADEDTEQKEETADALPALKILPKGSILSDVKVPRYTADLKPASLLMAERLEVLSDQAVAGTNVEIFIYEDNGSPRINTFLKSVHYDQQTGMIRSAENLTLTGNDLDAACQGVVLNWEKRKGFLLGKTQTLLYLNKAKQMTSSIQETGSSKPPKRAKIAAAGVALAASGIPTPLTAAQLDQIDMLARPATAQIQQVQQSAETSIKEYEQTSQSVDSEVNAFKMEVGNESLVIKNQAEPEAVKAKEAAEFVTITSDNGMYFNAETGHIVYSKNIVVTHPQYTLTCDDELKIILKKSPKPTDAKKDEAGKDGAENAGPLDINPGSSFSGVDKAIATGNVVVKGKDSNGKPVTAKAATAVYQEDGTIILKGGYPTITQGENMVRMIDKGGYIIIYPNMSVHFEGRNELKANIKDLQNGNKNSQ